MTHHEHIYDLSDLDADPLPCVVCGEPLHDMGAELSDELDRIADAFAGLPD